MAPRRDGQVKIPARAGAFMEGNQSMLMRILLCIALVVPSLAADLKVKGEPKRDELVRVESDTPGSWFVIGPNAITLQPQATVDGVTIGATKLNVREVITLDEGKECVFTGPPGAYAVIQFIPGETDPSHIVVVIPGKVDPEPGPGPNPPDPPDPIDGNALFVLIHETGDRSPQLSNLLIDARVKFRNDPNTLLILDKDSQPAIAKPAFEAWKQSGKELPVVVVCSEDGATVEAVHALPDTVEGIKELAK